VLAANDRIRFKLKTNFKGFLYVTNQSTSGNNTLLFPRDDTGFMNRIESGKDYVVPATAGAFRVEGPAGYDIVSWLVSPVALDNPRHAAGMNTQPPAATTMTPRCDDTVFKSRGDCVDPSAGPKTPEQANSQDLMIIREKKHSVISSPAALSGPVVYQFHLAHR
jgi:hypothetical protein